MIHTHLLSSDHSDHMHFCRHLNIEVHENVNNLLCISIKPGLPLREKAV